MGSLPRTHLLSPRHQGRERNLGERNSREKKKAREREIGNIKGLRLSLSAELRKAPREEDSPCSSLALAGYPAFLLPVCRRRFLGHQRFAKGARRVTLPPKASSLQRGGRADPRLIRQRVCPGCLELLPLRLGLPATQQGSPRKRWKRHAPACLSGCQ